MLMNDIVMNVLTERGTNVLAVFTITVLGCISFEFKAFQKYDSSIKCVRGHDQVFVKERSSLTGCVVLCHLKRGCVGVRYEPHSGHCAGCGLFSEVAPMSESGSSSVFYVQQDMEMNIVSARIRSDEEGSTTGRIELRYNSTWGAICDDGWTDNQIGFEDNNMAVTCNMLGYTGEVTPVPMWNRYKEDEDTLQFWLDDVQCTGTELTIVDCSFTGFGAHIECYPNEAVNLQCVP